MEIATWLFSSLLWLAGVLWSLVWFLIGGWVSTLLQIAVLIVTIYSLKYGWRRAPFEIWRRSQSFGKFFWSWIRARDPDLRPASEGASDLREIRVREFGDINISTLLSLAALSGLLAFQAL